MPLADPALLSAPSRLAALRATGLLDSPPEAAFDRLTRAASRAVGAPVALVSLVDDRRQFFKSAVGLGEPWATARETPLTHSFCQHVVATHVPLVVMDARAHPLVTDNLAIPQLGVIAYAGMPLTNADGETLGSFCAIDTKPREWSEDDLDILKTLAAAAMREVELRAAITELERMNRHKSEMVGFTSHELRTPLNGIMGALQVIDMELPPAADRKMVNVALESSRRLLRIINDLLDVEQLEAGAIPVRPTRQELDRLVKAALDGVRATAAERQVTLAAEPSGLTVSADADRIVQVLSNLVGNALKFTGPGTQIDVRATATGALARLARVAVVDRGRGVPDSHKAHVFERFVQVEAADKHQKGGAGLGLAICRAIVHQHHGTIWVEDTPGGGSTFAFTLPLAS